MDGAARKSSIVSKSGTICSPLSQPIQRASSNTLKTSRGLAHGDHKRSQQIRAIHVLYTLDQLEQ